MLLFEHEDMSANWNYWIRTGTPQSLYRLPVARCYFAASLLLSFLALSLSASSDVNLMLEHA